MLRIFVLVVLFTFFPLGHASARVDPGTYLSRIIETVFVAVNEKRSRYAEHKNELAALLGTALLGNARPEETSAAIAGTHWPRWSEEQKRVFTSVFSKYLLCYHSMKLLKYATWEWSLKKVIDDKDRSQVTVQFVSPKPVSIGKGEIRYQKYKVTYELHWDTHENTWWVFDVRALGISFVTHFKSDVSRRLREQNGYDTFYGEDREGDRFERMLDTFRDKASCLD